MPAETEIGRYYETQDYISHSDTHAGLMNRVYHWVRSYMLGSKARLVEKASNLQHGSLLDIGCGTGYFAHTMQLRGWEVEAIEKSDNARAFAQQQFGLKVQDESQTDSFGDQRFDVITLWHVMEHIENMAALWTSLTRQLKDSGRLIVAVPNCESYDASIYKSRWAAYDVPRHLWHFSVPTMSRMAQQYGFELISKRTMPFDAFYVSMLSEKYKGNKFYFLKGLCVGACCWLKTLWNVDKSSSLIFIFRKKR